MILEFGLKGIGAIPVWTVVLLLITTTVEAQDAQWRGPGRDGKYPDTGLKQQWPKGGPELILKKEGLGNGYSTPVLYEGQIYLSGRRDSLDVLTKLDLTGSIIWETAYGDAWDKSFPESRSTPTIENGSAYIMGGLGNIVCLDCETGEIIWDVNTHEEFKGEFHTWGMAESLLVTQNAVISSPVGERTAVVALDKRWYIDMGDEVTGRSEIHASPLLINYNHREMILVTSSKDLIAVDPEDGEVIWAQDIVSGHSTIRNRRNNTNTPVFHNGEIFTTCGYNVDGIMLKLSPDGNQVDEKWSDATLDTHHGGIVLVDGYLYGSNWVNNGNGNWVCQEWESGKVMYEKKWHNKGSIIYADGLLYVLEEKQGHVGLVKPTPEGFDVISSFKLEGGSGPWWAHMSIYDKKLFIRHGDVLFVYNIGRS